MALIALQGRPGSGKSTMCATFTKLGYHVHYVDMDEKLPTTQNLVPLLKAKKISYVQCPYPLSDRTLGQIARQTVKESYPKKQPQGYMWFCDYIDEMAGKPEGPTKVVPVIDSLSAVNRHLKNLLRYYTKSPKLGFDGWDTVLQNYQSLFDALRHLTPDPFPHIVVNIHIRDEVIKEGEETRVECRPFVDGQFREELASYLEEFYFLEVETAGKHGQPRYIALTVPVNHVKHARSSMGLPVKVDADFSTIFPPAEEVEDESNRR